MRLEAALLFEQIRKEKKKKETNYCRDGKADGSVPVISEYVFISLYYAWQEKRKEKTASNLEYVKKPCVNVLKCIVWKRVYVLYVYVRMIEKVILFKNRLDTSLNTRKKKKNISQCYILNARKKKKK